MNAEELYQKYPELAPHKAVIVDTDDRIQFIDPITGEIAHHISKERSRLATTHEQQTWQYDYLPDVMEHGMWYQITEDGKWLLQTEYLVDARERPETEQPIFDIKRQPLYDEQGKQVAVLPFVTEFVLTSPTGQHFVAYRLRGYESPEIAFIGFFSRDGTLLNTFEAVGMYLRMAFSQNGEFVVLSNTTLLTIFTKTGQLVYHRDDTRPMIHETWWAFYNIFVSEDGQFLLFQGEKNLYLYTQEEELLWQKPSEFTDECYFMTHKKLLFARKNSSY